LSWPPLASSFGAGAALITGRLSLVDAQHGNMGDLVQRKHPKIKVE